MDRFMWKSYLQATLEVGNKYTITALENKRNLQKKKTANLVVSNTVIYNKSWLKESATTNTVKNYYQQSGGTNLANDVLFKKIQV